LALCLSESHHVSLLHATRLHPGWAFDQIKGDRPLVLLLIGMVLFILKIADEEAVKRMLERLKQMAAQELQRVLEKRPVVEGIIRPTPER
jgi:hypothetical protein